MQHRLLCGAFLVAIGLISPAGCDDRAPGDHLRQATYYDGQTLFRGIFFGDGQVAQRLPSLWGNRPDVELGDRLAGLDAEGIDELLLRTTAQAHELGDERGVQLLEEARNNLRERRDARRTPQGEQIAALLAILDAADPEFFARFAEQIQSGDHLQVEAALEEARDVGTRVWEEIYVPAPGSEQGKDVWLYLETFVLYDNVIAHEVVWVNQYNPMPGESIHAEFIVDEIAINLDASGY